MKNLLVILFLLGFFAKEEFTQTTHDKYRLVWNDDPTTTITVAWDQLALKMEPVILFGKEDFGQNWEKYPYQQKPHREIRNYRGMNTMFAKLSGLEPDQVYYFIIKDNESVSKSYWFRTAPDKPKAFTFISGGDTKSNGSALEAGRFSNQIVAKLRPLFVLYNGDFTSGDGTNDDYWKQWLNDWSIMTTTEDRRMIPIIPVHGNHENGDKSVLNRLFDAPIQNNNPENVFYSISFGDKFIHLISLNSEIEEGGEQKIWLEENLKAHQDHTFKFTAYHKPFRPHTAKKSEQNHQYDQWAGLFQKYGVDLGFDADSHMSTISYPIRPSIEEGSFQGFIRDDKNGTMYIGEGSWGASPRDNNDNKPWTLRSGSFNQIKWLQVFPPKEDMPAHIKIRTIITSTRNKNDEVVSQVDKVKSLDEENLFKVPDNIKLFETEKTGKVILYPFHLN